MLSLLALVLIFGIVLNRLLEHSLFRRLASLTAQLRHIRPGQGNLTPIPVDGSDELALLAETINAGFLQLGVHPHAAGGACSDPGRGARGTQEPAQGPGEGLISAYSTFNR